MKLEISSLLDRIENANFEVQEMFTSLNTEQLTFRSRSKSWSIAECFDHILQTNYSYFEEFEKVLVPGYSNNLWKRFNPFTGMIGQSMIRSLGPEKKKSYSSPKLFLPRKEVSKDIINHFLESQIKLKEYMISLQESTDVIIYSPVSTVITLRLEDAFQILIGHEERHILQAKEVLNNKNFPHDKT